MRYVLAFAVLLLLVTAVSGQTKKARAERKEKYPPEFSDAKEEVYKTINGTQLKLFIFNPERSNPTEPRPAVVFFFGGGWTNGSPGQFQNQCRYLASRGMVAITADYRVASRHNVKAVDCVRDAKSAIRYVRENAARLGVDPQHIAAGGGSAGGHIAACTGTIIGLDEEGENTAISSVPNAMVLFNPVMSWDGLTTSDEEARIGEGRLGIDPDKLSPHKNVRAGQPPMIMFFGTDDKLLDGARAFAAESKKAGNECIVKEYDGHKHGFFNFGRTKGNEFFLKTLTEADAFLTSLGYMKGPPTVDEFFAKN
jgi:acetyl esterase/lipase